VSSSIDEVDELVSHQTAQVRSICRRLQVMLKYAEAKLDLMDSVLLIASS
jgi:hypothetical protein